MSATALGVRRAIVPRSQRSLALGAVAIGAAIWVGMAGVSPGSAVAYRVVPVAVILLSLWLFVSERYEATLAVLLIYLGTMDGVVKLATGSNVATLGRDLLLYSIVLGVVVRMILKRKPLHAPPLTGLVVAWVAVCVMQLANPANHSFLHAAAGLREDLEFVPLFFFGYLVLRSERRLTGLLVLLLVVGAANGIAGLIQSQLTPGQLATWGPGYAGLERGTALTAARVFADVAGHAQIRPPGLGGEDGFGGLVALMALPGAIALLTTSRRTVRLMSILAPLTILAVAAVATSQTRLAVVAAVIAVLAFALLTVTSRRGLLAVVLTILVAVAGYAIGSTVAAGHANRYSTLSPSQIVSTTRGARSGTISLVPTYLAKYPFGAGIGLVGPAASSNFGGSSVGVGLNAESEFTYLLVETGIPGFVILIVFMLVILRVGLSLRRVADVRLQRRLMAITAVLIAVAAEWYIGAVSTTSPDAPFIWFSAGCLAYWYGEVQAGRVKLRPRAVRTSLALH